ncbi:MAG: hypothetical protein JXA21_26620 [Anaerolineae bacterium]|nr:hypothetical protein [Anaerolineae bacterium]
MALSRDAEFALQFHSRALNDCNQRGGRMLSLVDLLDAGTVDLPLAAYLAALMRRGASLLVGARPGGAGKTAVMVALLNFLPDLMAIFPLDGASRFAAAAHDVAYGCTCYITHEIGAGCYYAYIWGEQVRDFLALAARGHCVASNLHADTLEAAHHQVCTQNGADPAHFSKLTLKLFLRVERENDWTLIRRVSHVYESNGQDHLVWRLEPDGAFARTAESALVTPDEERFYAEFLADLQRRDIRTIEDVRRELLAIGS